MTRRRRSLAILLLAAALVFAAAGQLYFLFRREYLWDGVVFHGVAAVCFLLAWRCALPRERKGRTASSASTRLKAWLRAHSVQVALLALGLLLSLTATLLSRTRVWNQTTTDGVILWLLGTVAVVVAAMWSGWNLPRSARGLIDRLRRVDQSTWHEIATVAVLTVLALLLRVMELESVPFTLAGDEAWHGLLARQVLDGELRNPFVIGYMSMPTLFYWLLSWSLRVAGDNVFGLRLPAALAGAATVPALYLFARHLWGRRVALVSAVLLAGYDYHIHFSRLGANNVWDTLFVIVALWALDVGMTSTQPARRTRWLIVSGLVMGLSVFFYTGARLLPLLVSVYVGYFVVRGLGKRRSGCRESGGCEKGDERNTRSPMVGHLVLVGIAFVVAAGPMLGFALAHPDDWNARINQVGIIQSGWLAREAELSGKGVLQTLGEQFLRAAGAFHVFADRTSWYDADRPLLGFLAGILALFGMAWSITHLRNRRYFLLLLWFWSVIVTGGMLTESPPSSQRLVIAIPAVILLVAMGLVQGVRLVQRIFEVDRRWGEWALGLLVLVLTVSSIHFYFVDYIPSRRYGSENGETATMLGHYLRGLGEGEPVYLFGAPRMYWSFGTMTFLAPSARGQDVVEPIDSPPDFVDDDCAAVFIFLPERQAELVWVQQACPDGRTREVRDSAGELRFTAYEVGHLQGKRDSREGACVVRGLASGLGKRHDQAIEPQEPYASHSSHHRMRSGLVLSASI